MTADKFASTLLVLHVVATAAGPVEAQESRRFANVTWELVAQYTDAAGVHLASPVLMSLCGRALSLLDLGTPHVALVSTELVPLAKFGRSGSGPGELRGPSDLSCDSQGITWLPDGPNGRVTRVSPSGTFDGSILVNRQMQRLAVAPDGERFWLSTPDPSHLALGYSRTGDLVVTALAPADLRQIDLLRREPWFVTTPDGGVIVAFRWSSRLIRIEADGSMGFSVDGPERVEFPLTRSYSTGGGNTMVRIAPGSTEAVLQLFRDEDVVVARFKGAGPDKGRVVDRFHAQTGRYLESLRLPVEPVSVATKGDTAFLLVDEPVPTIRKYLMRRRR